MDIVNFSSFESLARDITYLHKSGDQGRESEAFDDDCSEIGNTSIGDIT